MLKVKVRERYFKLITITCAFFRGKLFIVFACTENGCSPNYDEKKGLLAFRWLMVSNLQVCDFMRVFSDFGEFRDFSTSLLPI